MTQRSLAALMNNYRGGPILVIGGGPSVMPDLKRLSQQGFKPACVLSANEHGTKQPFYQTDYIVNADKIHCMAKDDRGMPIHMKDYLSRFQVPTINKHSFADYRLVDFTFNGNSGLTAVVVAAALGGDPVVVTGIDCWQGGRHYFHDGYQGAVPVEYRPLPAVTPRNKYHTFGVGAKAIRKMPQLIKACAGANIRPVSGPLLTDFPKYDPAEILPQRKPTIYAQQAAGPTYECKAVHSFEFTPRDKVAQDQLLMFSDSEMRLWSSKGKVEFTNSWTLPVLLR